MQEEKVHGRPARRRPAHPHHAPRGLNRHNIEMYTALEKPFVGLSDGRIYDPRSGFALDWWGTGTPEIELEPGTEIWQVVFSDGAAVATLKGIHVVAEPQVGQLRVQLPPQVLSPHRRMRWNGDWWVDPEPESPYTRSRSRTLRRERRCGRREIREGCPLLSSTRTQPQTWPPQPVQSHIYR